MKKHRILRRAAACTAALLLLITLLPLQPLRAQAAERVVFSDKNFETVVRDYFFDGKTALTRLTWTK